MTESTFISKLIMKSRDLTNVAFVLYTVYTRPDIRNRETSMHVYFRSSKKKIPLQFFPSFAYRSLATFSLNWSSKNDALSLTRVSTTLISHVHLSDRRARSSSSHDSCLEINDAVSTKTWEAISMRTCELRTQLLHSASRQTIVQSYMFLQNYYFL